MKEESMFGYSCPECGKGTIQPKTIPNYKTVIKGNEAVVPQATIGVCDQCGAKFFSAKECKRWEREQGDVTPGNAGETRISVTFITGSIGAVPSEQMLRLLVDDLKDRLCKATDLKPWGVQIDRAIHEPWGDVGKAVSLSINEEVHPGTSKVAEG